MNTVEKELQEITELSGYELTYHTIQSLAEFNLTPVAKLVLILLTTHYNQEKNKNVVFPSIQYIADTLGIGLTSTKQAIKDLISEGLILKSKLSKISGNHNSYNLTYKVKKCTSKQSENELSKGRIPTVSCIEPVIEQINQPTHDHKIPPAPKKVVVVNFTSKEDVSIPKCIKQNKSIRNKIAYWRSLSPTVKQEYIKKDKELERIERRAKQDTRETKELLNSFEEMEENREAPTDSWLALKEKLKNARK